MKTVALFGGSFNPPHKGHEAILRWLLTNPPTHLDGVGVLPTVNHAFGKELLPYEARADLVQAMVGDDPRVEIIRRDETYMAEVLEALHTENPDTHYILVLGADILNDLDKWHRWDDVLRLAEPLFVFRKGVQFDANGTTVHCIDAPGVSSTDVRKWLAEGNPEVAHFLPEAVLSRIEEKGYYGVTKPFSW